MGGPPGQHSSAVDTAPPGPCCCAPAHDTAPDCQSQSWCELLHRRGGGANPVMLGILAYKAMVIFRAVLALASVALRRIFQVVASSRSKVLSHLLPLASSLPGGWGPCWTSWASFHDGGIHCRCPAGRVGIPGPNRSEIFCAAEHFQRSSCILCKVDRDNENRSF